MNYNSKKPFASFSLLLATILIASCSSGGSSSSSTSNTNTYTIGGNISGLVGTGLVLQNNNADNLTLGSSSIDFVFSTKIPYGGNYSVTVASQPTNSTCSVSSATGTVSGDVTNVSVVCNSYDVKQIVAGNNETYAISTNNKLFRFGNSITIPQAIDSTENYQNLSAYDSSTCAITTTGVLKCWGVNNYGQLGDGTTTSRAEPTVVSDSGVTYSSVNVGVFHTCAITTAGVLKCWGYNWHSRLGDGTTTDKHTQVVIDNGVSYFKVTAGYSHTCGITISNVADTSGKLKCWGWNYYGQVGNGTTTEVSVPTVIDSGTNYSDVSAGNYFTCGIAVSNATDISGVLKCWGSNEFNTLGDGTTTNRATPTIIDSGINYSKVSVGDTHACGIVTSSKNIKCWGKSSEGQLGDNNLSTHNVSTPTAIYNPDGHKYNEITAGYSSTCARLTDNRAQCWGKGTAGELGDGSLNNSGTPVWVQKLPN